MVVPVELRHLAASQLAFHIQRFGLLLKPDIAAKLPRYVETEGDPQVKLALESVIGALKPNAAAARKQILEFPASPAPLGGSGSSSGLLQ
jgi:hypothetical protein